MNLAGKHELLFASYQSLVVHIVPCVHSNAGVVEKTDHHQQSCLCGSVAILCCLAGSTRRLKCMRFGAGVNAVSTAEGALCCIFMLARKAEEQQQSFREGRLGLPLGMQLHSKTLGIIGMGAIGTQTLPRKDTPAPAFINFELGDSWLTGRSGVVVCGSRLDGHN
jgi:hypothetical protein